MKRPESPCKDCQKRAEGCHGKCEDYQKYRIEQEQYNQERFTEKDRYLNFPPRVRAITRNIGRGKK